MPTQNMNNLQSSSWVAYIPGLDGVTFKLKNFIIPSVTLGVTEVDNRTEFHLFETGNKFDFDELNLDFIVDADLKNYKQLYRWMRHNGYVQQATTRDLYVTLLDNNRQFQGVTVQFVDAFPINLSPIMLDVEGDTTDVLCTVMMKYLYFDFVDDQGGPDPVPDNTTLLASNV